MDNQKNQHISHLLLRIQLKIDIHMHGMFLFFHLKFQPCIINQRWSKIILQKHHLPKYEITAAETGYNIFFIFNSLKWKSICHNMILPILVGFGCKMNEIFKIFKYVVSVFCFDFRSFHWQLYGRKEKISQDSGQRLYLNRCN